MTFAIAAAQAPSRTKPSNYPEPFASQMAGRIKRPLGELFGLSNYRLLGDASQHRFAVDKL